MFIIALNTVSLVEFITFSVTVEKLNVCSKLHTIDLKGNCLYEVSNLESCQQLWNIDLSNNEVCVISQKMVSLFNKSELCTVKMVEINIGIILKKNKSHVV